MNGAGVNFCAWGVVGAAMLSFALVEPVQAAYKPEVQLQEKDKAEAKKGIATLKVLPAQARWACIAERLGLLYIDAVDSAYSGRPKTDDAGYRFYPVKHGSKYVGANGKELDFFTERDAARQKKITGSMGSELWNKAMLSIEIVGEDAVFSAYSAEVTKIVQQTVRRQLRLLPKEMRDAWLAQLADLVYMEDGSDAYGEEKSCERYGTIDMSRQITWREPLPNAVFWDASGKQWKMDEVWGRKGISGRVPYTLELLRWCVNLIGSEDILSLFSRDVKQMRKFRAESQASAAQE